jgi:HAD superfamily hydrolase (TIGR01509 family)
MNPLKLSHFEAVIFDMDGVLIDSEPTWKIAMEQVFASVGCHLTVSDFEKTTGLRIDQVVDYWYQYFPWENASPAAVVERIIQRMVELLSASGKPLPGVRESLAYFKSRGLKIGLATSSYEVLVETVLKTLDIRDYFLVTHSAEKEKYGKPHPAVYLTAAAMLGVDPLRCLVIEDSLNGVIAGKAARMQVICIPEKTHTPNPKLVVADYHFEDLPEMLAALKALPVAD